MSGRQRSISMDIDTKAIAPSPLDWHFKAWPAGASPRTSDMLAELRWSLLREDVMLPAAVLHEPALRHNSAWMRRFTELSGVRLAPHGKTTMSPELFALQLADGAWGITAATVSHVRAYRAFGIGRILLANQLIGRQATDYVLGELARDPDFDFYCLVDSLDAVERLEAAIAAYPGGGDLRLQLFLELGMNGGRAGLRDNEDALALARRIAASPVLALRGIEAFEGIVQGSGPDGENRMRDLLARMTQLAGACVRDGLFSGRPILTAGGSSFFDVAATMLKQAGDAADFEVILRSGCYLVHDSQFYARLVEQLLERSPQAASLGEGLKPALEVWAYVHSRPEPGRVIAGLGKRDTSADVAYPVPLRWARPGTGSETTPPAIARLDDAHRTVRLDDQHAYLDVPADSPLQVGDMIGFGISHPCTTFDRWPALYLVDEALTVTGAIRTFF